jgi:hypothetical protein
VLRQIPSTDPSQLAIVESIGEGGQAHVFLGTYARRPGGMEEAVVFKRYKARLEVRAVIIFKVKNTFEPNVLKWVIKIIFITSIHFAFLIINVKILFNF